MESPLDWLRTAMRGKTVKELHAVAKRMGVAWGTFSHLVYDQTQDPRYSTVEKITRYRKSLGS